MQYVARVVERKVLRHRLRLEVEIREQMWCGDLVYTIESAESAGAVKEVAGRVVPFSQVNSHTVTLFGV